MTSTTSLFAKEAAAPAKQRGATNVAGDRPDNEEAMLTKLVSTRRRTSSRRFLLWAAVSVAVVPVGLGAAGDEQPGPERDAPATAPEPRLGLAAPGASPKPPARAPRRGQQPVVVRALPPGHVPEVEATSGEGPPAHIARENVRLRRELQHLKALQAERRRVSQALNAAGAVDGSLLVGSGRLIWPISGPLTSPFGQRWGRLHAGVDISAPAGTPIRAADSGRVALAGWQGGYGLYTCVQHTSSLSTCYAHQSRLGTVGGATVRQGQVIGFVGNTGHSFGDHLHFETWVRGKPVDPMGFL